MNPSNKSAIQLIWFTLTIGEYFSQFVVKDIKDQLQQKNGVQVLKTTTQQGNLIFYCKNAKENGCQYGCTFEIDKRSSDLAYYQLSSINMKHNENCFGDEQGQNFIINKQYLNSLSGAVAKIIAQRLRNYEMAGNPSKILEILCRQMDLKQDFFHKNVQDNHLKRKLRKRFDNIVAEAKRNIPKDILNKYSPQQLQSLLSQPKLKKGQHKKIRYEKQFQFQNTTKISNQMCEQRIYEQEAQ